jgi:uncharacterized repeat protein (TIGR03987 family)
MNTTLIIAIVSIVTAAVIYTVAVFSERAAGVLKPWHLALFWGGLVFDTLGTTLMSDIAGGWRWDLHGVIGAAAIVLMLVHSVWATLALLLDRRRALESFHTFSMAVWALWMGAFGSGIVMTALASLQGGRSLAFARTGVCPLRGTFV